MHSKVTVQISRSPNANKRTGINNTLVNDVDKLFNVRSKIYSENKIN